MRLRLLFATAAAALAFVAGPVGAHDMQHMTMDAAGQPTSASLYNLESKWTTPGRGERSARRAWRQAGRGGDGLYVLQGHVPGDRRRHDVDRKASASGRGGARRFAFFSFNSAVDTPAKLKVYADEHGLDPDRWTLFHGDDDAVRELAAALGVAYRPDGQGGFDHAAVISLIDEKGEIVFQQRGTQASSDELLAALNSLLEKRN